MSDGDKVCFFLDTRNEDSIKMNPEMRIFISQKIGRDWKRLARNLDIEDKCEVDLLIIQKAKDCDKLEDKCNEIFNEIRKKIDSLYWNCVKNALREIERNEIVSEFEEFYFENGRLKDRKENI